MPQFTGYDHALLHQESQIVAAETITKGKKTELVVAIDPCPFYGLGGGQVPDTGFITLANGSQWKVTDVFQPYEGGIALKLVSPKGSKEMQKQLEEDQEFLQVRVSHHELANGSHMLFFLQVGNLVRTEIDVDKRQGAEVHHTATHLLNAGLRAILKTDIVQAGWY